MSEFKGTPGPWSVGAEDADNGEIEVISEARPYVCMVLPGAIDGTTAANARLIAAAPDLLEALIHARKELQAYEEALNGEDYNSLLINAAIEKAAGETQ